MFFAPRDGMHSSMLQPDEQWSMMVLSTPPKPMPLTVAPVLFPIRQLVAVTVPLTSGAAAEPVLAATIVELRLTVPACTLRPPPGPDVIFPEIVLLLRVMVPAV